MYICCLLYFKINFFDICNIFKIFKHLRNLSSNSKIILGYEYLCILTFVIYFLNIWVHITRLQGYYFFGLYINKIKYIKRTMITF